MTGEKRVGRSSSARDVQLLSGCRGLEAPLEMLHDHTNRGKAYESCCRRCKAPEHEEEEEKAAKRRGNASMTRFDSTRLS